jgi:HSP20 family protein
MGRFFDRFLENPWGAFQERDWAMTPRVDIVENDKEVVVTAEVPGMDEKDFDISLTADTLTLHGEKKAEREEKKGNWYRVERSYGSFHRTVPLPCQVDSDKVEARYSKGVLTITLPKLPEEKQHRKRIEVH